MSRITAVKIHANGETYNAHILKRDPIAVPMPSGGRYWQPRRLPWGANLEVILQETPEHSLEGDTVQLIFSGRGTQTMQITRQTGATLYLSYLAQSQSEGAPPSSLAE